MSELAPDHLIEVFPEKTNSKLTNLRRRAVEEIPGFTASWQDFVRSWDRLQQDAYMGDGGRYRFRRYAVFESQGESILKRSPDQRHYQKSIHNRINGGIFREYPCFEQQTLENPVFQWLLDQSLSTAKAKGPSASGWHVEAHQFRITASAEEIGKPVPEGIHRDGVDFVFIYLVQRCKVRGGASRVYTPVGRLVEQHKMREPLDVIAIDDREVLHNVTPIRPLKEEGGFRDVLVITVRATDSAEAA
ncbi:MAG: 2OG-Fe dioxygenase family protein [bacterium]